MITMVPLSRIHDNPFQARTDYPDIPELAEAIAAMKAALPATRGLIHPPNGRFVRAGIPELAPHELDLTELDWHVELADGHRRLRAFRVLAESDPDYLVMPVTLGYLSDQIMDDLAWDENEARKDLSCIEEARALARTQEKFGLTQEQLGERRRLARSTVANKLRLLQLPEALQTAIHAGKLSERHGMAYLTIMDIPPADLALVEAKLAKYGDFLARSYWPPHPTALLKRLLERDDVTADDLRFIASTLKQRIEDEKRVRWEAERATAAVREMKREIANPPPARAYSMSDTLAHLNAPREPDAPEHVRYGGDEPAAGPLPQVTLCVPGEAPPLAGAAIRRVPGNARPGDTTDVEVSITIQRPAGHPRAFRVRVYQGSPNRVTHFAENYYCNLLDILESLLLEVFEGIPAVEDTGEQQTMPLGTEPAHADRLPRL